MSIVETVLVFVGIPAGIFLLLAILVLGPGAMRSPRYRPGNGWDFEPVWYLPHPSHPAPAGSIGEPNRSEVPALPGRVDPNPIEPVRASGGASGEW